MKKIIGWFFVIMVIGLPGAVVDLMNAIHADDSHRISVATGEVGIGLLLPGIGLSLLRKTSKTAAEDETNK